MSRLPSHEKRVDAVWAGVAVLVVGTLAFAVTRVDAGSDSASAHVLDANGAAELTKGLNGDAVVRAGHMQPGGRATGTVTIANAGGATGAFRMVQTDVLDTPGAGGGRLSTVLRLQVDDARSGRAMYRGKLSAMNAASLGYLRAGEKRTYRVVLTAPPAATTPAYAGSQVEAAFDWTATTGEPPTRPERPDTAPPTVVVQAAPSTGRRLTITLSCDERCTVVGVSRGTPVAPRRLRPGRPALLAVDLPPADAAAIDGLLERRGGAALPLRVTVADPAGNRTTAAVTVPIAP